MKYLVIMAVMISMFTHDTLTAQTSAPAWLAAAKEEALQKLIEKHGESVRARASAGLRQAADFWREDDGNQQAFVAFSVNNYAGTQAEKDILFQRFQYLLERIDGHMTEISRELKVQSELDLGPIMPYDEIFAGYNAAAHLNDDFFQNKLAFIVLLNFPLKSPDEKTKEGASWTRRQWAEVRLAERYAKRIPAPVLQEYSKAVAESDQYIAEYNIFMGKTLSEKGEKLFPESMRLLSHWNLRDEIKVNYGDAANGFTKQKTIAKVMERIVTQTIPAAVINNPNYEWNPYTNEVMPAAKQDAAYPIMKTGLQEREPDTRYHVWRQTFLAAKLLDAYSPTAPTHIERKFDEDRELPEQRVKKMFEEVLRSPLAFKVAALIEQRLGRKLEAFDIWYNGFKPKTIMTGEQLDAIVKKRYPTAASFQEDMPNILTGLGFSKDKAAYLSKMIVVDPARGSGHAMGAAMRESPARLRTRVGKDGMDYKGFNIAIHELGHNVEQVFSLSTIDHTLLQGVPNTAFTEALAFVFQAHDLELLGVNTNDKQAAALKAINDYWMTFEIAGVALVDMAAWHWLYDHPNASGAEFREAVLSISKKIWNEFYAPVLGVRDVSLLCIYSHMIHSFLYLPDYPLGHIIAQQIEEQMNAKGKIGTEFERVAKLGRLSPDEWMIQATGKPVSADALLESAEKALAVVGAAR